MFPEGTRSQSGELGPFRGGIGRLAAEFPNLPIIPVWLDGTALVLPKNASFPRPVRVCARFGPPAPHALARLDDKASWRVVATQVREAVMRLRP